MAKNKLFSVLCIFFVFLSTITSCAILENNNHIPDNQSNSIEQCKWKVTTSTRIYYTNSYDSLPDGGIVLHGFFSYEEGKWVWYEGDLQMSKLAFPEAKIIEQGGPEDKEPYIFSKGSILGWQTAQLRTIKQWWGTNSQDIKFTVDKTPWVLNAGYNPTSKISSLFSVLIFKKDIYGNESGPMRYITPSGVTTILVEEKGTYTIRVQASGCQWWIKIGVE